MNDERDENREAGEQSLEERLAELEKENAGLLDRLMRTVAEYENFRKRVSRERSAWTMRALESLVLDLLPVQDSFDRAIESAVVDAEPEAMLEGMKLVRRLLTGALKKHGVEPIEAIGEIFDPQYHEGFLTRPVAEGEEPGTVVEEVEKGYRMGERTIRATKGIVAAVPEETDSSASPEEE